MRPSPTTPTSAGPHPDPAQNEPLELDWSAPVPAEPAPVEPSAVAASAAPAVPAANAEVAAPPPSGDVAPPPSDVAPPDLELRLKENVESAVSAGKAHLHRFLLAVLWPAGLVVAIWGLAARLLFADAFPPILYAQGVLPLTTGAPSDWYPLWAQLLGALAPPVGVFLVFAGRKLQVPHSADLPGWTDAAARVFVPGYQLIQIPWLLGAIAAVSGGGPARKAVVRRAGLTMVATLTAMVTWVWAERFASLQWEAWAPVVVWGTGLLAAVLALITAAALRRELSHAPAAATEADAELAPEAASADERLGPTAVLDLECPDCGGQTPLFPVLNLRGAAACRSCGGALVPGRLAPTLFQQLGVGAASLDTLARGGEGRASPCPECQAATRVSVVRAASIRACPECSAVWVRAGGLVRLSRGKYGYAPPAPHVPQAPPPRFRERPGLLGLAALALVLFGGAYAFRMDRVVCGRPGKVVALTLEGSRAAACSRDGQTAVGAARLRDASGRLLAEGLYVRGQRQGDFTTYHPNGRIAEQGRYVQGRRQGEFLAYSEDGVAVRKSVYKDDALHGVELRLHRDGTVASKTPYENGEKHGEFARYDEGGILRERGMYANGLAAGRWEVFDEAGTLVAVGLDGAEPRPLAVPAAVAAAAREGVIEDSIPLRGGRTVAWWQSRLRTLRSNAQSDPAYEAVFRLTIERAKANGLQVEENATSVAVSIAATPSAGSAHAAP